MLQIEVSTHRSHAALIVASDVIINIDLLTASLYRKVGIVEKLIVAELNKVKALFNIICIGNLATSAAGGASRFPTETAYIRDTLAAGAERCQFRATKLGDRLKPK